MKCWILRRVAERRNISERIEKSLELELKFAEGWAIHEQTGQRTLDGSSKLWNKLHVELWIKRGSRRPCQGGR